MITEMNQISQIPTEPTRAKIHYSNGEVENRRVLRDRDSIRFAVYSVRSRSSGNWYGNFGGEIKGIEIVNSTPKDEPTVWLKSWTKALKMLQESGLWTDLQEEISLGIEIGYEKFTQASDLYRENYSDDNLELIKGIDPRLIRYNDDWGKIYLNSIVWRMNIPAIIKKMYFGKNSQGWHLRNITEHMEKKESYSCDAEAGYDVSFEYNAEKNKAWYSEQYRGCGNGHYYLALSATHAMFSEDD